MNSKIRLFLVSVMICVAASANAQVTKNQFVGATVQGGTGSLTIYKGDPANKEYLTFHNDSYLTVYVQGQYYSNNPFGGKIGPNGAPQSLILLNSGQTSKIGDTIRTVWPETGFDIVQNAYPVAFTNSGVIVISVKIVNHTGAPLSAAAQFLLDNMNSNDSVKGMPASANDNPFVIHPYGYVHNWQDCQATGGGNPIPSFSLSFEFPPDSVRQGSVGVGYANDSFPPHPLGLMPPAFIEFGDWADQINYTWGPPGLNDRRPFVSDLATLLMGSAMTARAGSTDSVTEIFRTAYGTQEFTFCYGKVLAITASPTTRLTFRESTQDYSPNRFYSMTIVYNSSSTADSDVSVIQNAGSPLQTLGANPIPPYGNGFKLASNAAASVLFQDTVQAIFPGDSMANMFVQVYAYRLGPSLSDSCMSPIAIFYLSQPKPVITVQSRTGSFDGGVCNARTTYILATDTNTPPLGFAGATTLSATNMAQITWAPPHAFNILPIAVHVIDSMLNGQIVLRIVGNDSSATLDTIRYCTIPDRLPPTIDRAIFDGMNYIQLVVDDSRPWDRGVDSLTVTETNLNVTQTPSGRTATILRADPIDPHKSSTLCVHVVDNAGNKTDSCFSLAPSAGVGISGNDASSLHIYPNPSADIFTINVEHASPLAQMAEVLDVLGRTVAQFQVAGTATFDAGALPAGTYVVRVGGMSQRIVKE